MGKMGSGEDVSNCAAFLSSDEASYITGEKYMLTVECICLDNSYYNLSKIY